MAERTKIIKTTIKDLAPDSIVWDTDVRGFCARRQRSAAVSYCVFYRTVDGRQRWATIGKHGSPWAVEGARKEAKRLLADVAAGGDPSGEKIAERTASTVAELCDRYLADAKAGKLLTKAKVAKKASTIATDEVRIERHIKPLLGRLKVEGVTLRDIEKFQDDVTDAKGGATRTLGLLGAILQFAVKKGLCASNPVRGIERVADGQRDRRVSDDEYARLGEALRTPPDSVWPIAVAASRFLAVTGWRRGEMLALRWTEVDLASRTASLADTKTGKSMRPLSHAAVAVLRSAPRLADGALVFPASRGVDQEMDGFHKVWLRIAGQAGLPADITPHILRHSFASEAGDLGYSELTIAALIGHKAGSITSKYVHAADAVLLKAADDVALRIEQKLGFAKPAGEVVDFQKRA